MTRNMTDGNLEPYYMSLKKQGDTNFKFQRKIN